MGKYLETPIFYMGNKYKLLKQLLPLFPDTCDVFFDLFGGSGVVSMNYKGDKGTVYNEFNPNIFELVKLFKDNTFEELDSYFTKVIEHYNLLTGLKRNQFDSEEEFLADTNPKKERYNKFREDYNNSVNRDYKDLWILSVFSCNHLIRFNSNSQFNASFGSNGNYNDNLKIKVRNGCEGLKDVILMNKDTLKLNFDAINKNDFVYLDPPYLNTEAVYNEKRAFGGWNIDCDYILFNKLESLNEKGVKWGLSNVFENRGVVNTHLVDWCTKNGWIVHYLNRNYNPFSRGNSNDVEVYICNYNKEVV